MIEMTSPELPPVLSTIGPLTSPDRLRQPRDSVFLHWPERQWHSRSSFLSKHEQPLVPVYSLLDPFIERTPHQLLVAVVTRPRAKLQHSRTELDALVAHNALHAPILTPSLSPPTVRKRAAYAGWPLKCAVHSRQVAPDLLDEVTSLSRQSSKPLEKTLLFAIDSFLAVAVHHVDRG